MKITQTFFSHILGVMRRQFSGIRGSKPSSAAKSRRNLRRCSISHQYPFGFAIFLRGINCNGDAAKKESVKGSITIKKHKKGKATLRERLAGLPTIYNFVPCDICAYSIQWSKFGFLRGCKKAMMLEAHNVPFLWVPAAFEFSCHRWGLEPHTVWSEKEHSLEYYILTCIIHTSPPPSLSLLHTYNSHSHWWGATRPTIFASASLNF